VSSIALIGNPNVGKSVIFNALTGLRQKVANFPGCTVEKKEGTMTGEQQEEIMVIDLPGVYSLTPYSIDEKIARDYILDEKPDLVIDVIDGSNLERNLYLTTQLLELGLKVLVVVNMMDLAVSKGISINTEQLSKKLGVPVVSTIAPKGEGIEMLKSSICELLATGVETTPLTYNGDVGKAISEVEAEIKSIVGTKYPASWLAISLLENDESAWEIANSLGITKNSIGKHIEKITDDLLGGNGTIAISDARYSKISSYLGTVQTKTESDTWGFSDMLDEVFTHRVWGIPLFIAIMWGVFQFTFTVGDPFIGLVEMIFGYLGDLLFLISEGAFMNFVVGTLIDGVGSVLVFLPNILLLFVAIAFLEDSGYLSRVSFIMDRMMNRVGLNGQSFIPMLLGFGCNVPAVNACRAIKNENDRMTTIMVNGFMSCGARLPVYVLLGGAFAATLGSASSITLLLYLLGMIVAVLVALLLRNTVFRGEGTPFIMELQPYTNPTFKSVTRKTWDRGKMFLKKATSVIMISVAIIWLFSNVEFGGISIMEEVGTALSYAFWWMKTDGITGVVGPGWQFGSALLFGLIAKEVVVGALGVSLGVGEEVAEDDPVLQGKIAEVAGPAAGMAFMVFSLLYVPCIAVLGAIKQETNSWKWMFFNIGLTLVVAYVAAVVAYYVTGAIVGFGLQPVV
jgi:ferrous iron transport protein B